MAAPMIPPATAPAFLAAHGWEGAEILPLAGDASFRRYFRAVKDGKSAVLMDAPPEHEDVGPFLSVAGHLLDRGFLPPRPLAVDRERGLLLLEDFGDDRVGPLLASEPQREGAIYREAVDILARLGADPAPSDLAPYDEAAMAREVLLFTDWYGPAVGLDLDPEGFLAAWREAWRGVLERVRDDPVLVLRDYHADNLMVLPGGALGLLDFQDALAGHRAYDLVSLLQDARRDVRPELEEAMLHRYAEAAGVADLDAFRAHYEVLGAQRNIKILGIFTRLWKRDGKPGYPRMHPRIWTYVERNLDHRALAPVRAWFDAHVPAECRGDACVRAMGGAMGGAMDGAAEA
jgi:aminoglycoside/choline kinase family phosphotransferase